MCHCATSRAGSGEGLQLLRDPDASEPGRGDDGEGPTMGVIGQRASVAVRRFPAAAVRSRGAGGSMPVTLTTLANSASIRSR